MAKFQPNPGETLIGSVCVCYLNRESGGTAYTVRYAGKKGLEIINLAT